MKKLQDISNRTAAEVIASVGPSSIGDASTVALQAASQSVKQYNEASAVVNRIREWHREFALCPSAPDDKLYSELTAQLAPKRKALKAATRELEDAKDESASADVIAGHEATLRNAKRDLQQTNAAIDRAVLDMSMMVKRIRVLVCSFVF